jgi:hypothetical protein
MTPIIVFAGVTKGSLPLPLTGREGVFFILGLDDWCFCLVDYKLSDGRETRRHFGRAVVVVEL